MVPTRRDDVVDDFHGTKVTDPYRWLEDGDSEEVKQWTALQNEQTRGELSGIPGRDALRARLKELLAIGFVAAPAIRRTAHGLRYFHQRREGAQNQPVLYVRDGLRGEDRALLDPGPMSPDGTVAVDWWMPSHDGALVAWGRSESGSEESTLYVRDVVTGEDLDDRIPDTRHASVAWLPDSSGFFYSRFPAAGTVPAGDEKYYCRIFFHRLGDDPKDDALVFGEGRDKLDVPSVDITPDGKWLVVRVHQGWQKSEIYAQPLAEGRANGAAWIPVATGKDALFEPIPHDDRLYVMTNLDAPRYRLFEARWDEPELGKWREILPQGDDVLTDVVVLRSSLVAATMRDASTRIERFTKDGVSIGPVALPSIGSAGITGRWDDDDLFVSFTSFVVPFTVYRCDLAEPSPLEVWDAVGAGVALPDVEVRLLHATSKDGTKIPMFAVARRGVLDAGGAPAILWGYGGFNISQTPAFGVRTLVAVERGAVWVSALLRGGGEYGEEWHRAGMREKKQNVFDDVIACAEELVARKITSPDRLAIVGGSNGGLLVAAAVVQRPELFRAALSLVPLCDMLRYHRFRIGKLWIPEYGSADDPADFPFLYAYSPYHRVVDGTSYPAILFATAESDSRVDPMHARKMAARMQAAQGAARPVLLRVESKAGHGAGKPITKVEAELEEELAFVFREVGA